MEPFQREPFSEKKKGKLYVFEAFFWKRNRGKGEWIKWENKRINRRKSIFEEKLMKNWKKRGWETKLDSQIRAGEEGVEGFFVDPSQ